MLLQIIKNGKPKIIRGNYLTSKVLNLSLEPITNNLNKEHDKCIEDSDYSFTECLKSFAEKETSCRLHLHILDNSINRNKTCPPKNLLAYFNLLIKLRQVQTSEIVKMSGCYPKCKIVQYSYETKTIEAKWTNNWTSQVFLQPKSSLVEYKIEHYSFDYNDLISNIGGFLGLFLGWSFLTIIGAISFIICKIIKISK